MISVIIVISLKGKEKDLSETSVFYKRKVIKILIVWKINVGIEASYARNMKRKYILITFVNNLQSSYFLDYSKGPLKHLTNEKVWKD